jgi:predicted dehydrogenase
MELWSYAREPGWHAPFARETIAPPTLDPLAEQLRHFCAVVKGHEQPLIPVEDAMGTLAVVEAVSEAARTSQKISPGQIMEQAA